MSEQPTGGSDFFHNKTDKKQPDHYVYQPSASSRPQVFRREEADKIFGEWDDPFVEDNRLLWSEKMEQAEMPNLHEIRKERQEVPLDDNLEQAAMPDLSKVRKENKTPPELQYRTQDCDFMDNEFANELRTLSGVKCKATKKKRREERSGMRYPWTLEGNSHSALRATWSNMKKAGEVYHSGLPIYLQNIVEGEIDTFDVEVNNFCKIAGLKYRTEKEDLLVEAAALKSLCSEIMKRVDVLVDNYNQRGVRNE